jgi:small conductance mechanosensitive channel
MTIGNISFVAILLMLVKAALIYIIGRFIINIVVTQVKKMLGKKSVDPMLEGFTLSILRFLLFFVLIMAILQTFGVQTTSLIAVLGAASLAIGLALQGNLSNFASGVMLVTLKPFEVGHFVEAGGVSGTIIEIGIFHSTLKTPDNKKILVPNNSITSGTITNFSAYAERRLDLVIGVSYDSDIDQVKKAIKEEVEAHEMVLADKPVLVRLAQMADSSLNFNVRMWTYTENYWDLYYDMHELIKKRLDAEGISIPYPHVTVEMKK